MGLREEAKEVVIQVFGPVNAAKVDTFDDSDPKTFLDNCKALLDFAVSRPEHYRSFLTVFL